MEIDLTLPIGTSLVALAFLPAPIPAFVLVAVGMILIAAHTNGGGGIKVRW